MKNTLARLALATSLVTVAACHDRTPQILTMPAQTQPQPEPPGQMAVTGTATLEVIPDCADLTMTITADGARPGLAAAGVQAKQAALVAALKKLGIETADLKLSHLNLNPIYAPNQDGWAGLKIATYRAEITITATTKQFELVGSMMEAGANAGASSMSSQFRRSDIAELKKKVREMALKAAKDKAQQTANTLGIQLGRVVSVNETPNGILWGSAYFPRNTPNAMDMVGTSAQGAIAASAQTLTLDIAVGFELAKQA